MSENKNKRAKIAPERELKLATPTNYFSPQQTNSPATNTQETILDYSSVGNSQPGIQQTMIDYSSAGNNSQQTLIDHSSFTGNSPLGGQQTIVDTSAVNNSQLSTQQTIASSQHLENINKTYSQSITDHGTVNHNANTRDAMPEIFANRYKITKVLGSGAMGKVYEAIDTTQNTKVAIKVIHKSQEGSQDIVKRFYRESKLLDKLNHPNIIRIHDSGECDGQPYFVMDLVEGSTFGEVLKNKKFPLRRKLILLIQVLEAVHSAHLQGVIHRDLKPENIMVTTKNQALVMDFGIARDQEDNQSTRLTKTGMLVGTPLYMSPEQINGEKVTNQSDVYTLGVIMYEVITNTVPFSGNISKIMWQVAHSDPAHPREVRSDIAKDLAKICLKAMAKEKQQRYTTARAMANDIKRYLKGEKISVKSSVDVKKVWEKYGGSVIIPVLILIVGFMFLLPNNSTDEEQIAELPNDQKIKNSVEDSQSKHEKGIRDRESQDHFDEKDSKPQQPDHDKKTQDRFNERDSKPQQPDNRRPQDRFNERDSKPQQPDHDRRPQDRFDQRDSRANEQNDDPKLKDQRERIFDGKRRRKLRKNIRDRFQNSQENEFEDDERPRQPRDRFNEIDDSRKNRFHDSRRRKSRFDDDENHRDFDEHEEDWEHTLMRHFHRCHKCKQLVRKKRIYIGRPPQWSKVPKDILEKIKRHAEKD